MVMAFLSFSSPMIVNQFNIECVRACKAENDAPIRPHGNGPEPLQIALERMQAIARKRKFLWSSRFIEDRHDLLNCVPEVGPNPASVVALVQPLEAPVPEAPDHRTLL
jgi:hypothetical protein